MKLVQFQERSDGAEKPMRAGILLDERVIDITAVVLAVDGARGDALMETLIDNFPKLLANLERASGRDSGFPLAQVQLHVPVRPRKILCCIGNYWEHARREANPLGMYMKNPDAVIGPDDTVVLPSFQASVFHHEAELGVVMRGPAKDVSQADYQSAVFGYTCFIDVSARGEGRRTWSPGLGGGGFLGKSFDTFAPIGPCITTADEIPDPNALAVKFWNDGQLRHDYTTDDMEHRVSELVSFATGIMTLRSGDIISCGTNHEGLGPMQDGEECVIEIEKIGRMRVHVRDPLKRKWERGIYLGPESTARLAVKRSE